MKLFQVLAVTLFLTGMVACQEKCDKNNKFCFPNAVQTWNGAVEYCTRNGWMLAVVNSEAKQKKIESLANKLDAVKSGKVELWIGANDLNKEGHFVWNGNGKPVAYSKWLPGKPDNKNGKEHCVHLWYEKAKNLNWGWNDVVCSSKRRFVCERKKL
ncbi:perlucin-like [Ochlerotatus camptorhynchus]|uniref:perlucin-like n=1 Tax=Ochlerotatus camptorhynchus TaxID=644619 RepID=UPI0031D4B25E